MSFNQSKSEKSESHFRKSGRSGNSGNQRSFSGNNAGGKGGGGNAAPPPQSSNNRSYRKPSNGQGGQSRANNSSELNVSAARPGQNGAHVQPPLPGVSDATASGVAVKPTNAPAPRSSRPVPKASASQSTTAASESVAPSTPAKGDESKGSGFTLQFGSISPGFVNGMQIPARTSSAPPNLDEQKRDQTRHDSFRAVPTLPIPSGPKQQHHKQQQQQQQLVKDAGSINKSSSGESHAAPQVKREVHSQAPVVPVTTVAQKPSVPITGVSMPMPYQSQVPVPFSGPSSQIQSQGVAATSMQMAMQLPAGSTSQMPQQVFVPSLQSHPLQTQGMIQQGQGLGFAPQISHQLAPQLGMGMGMGASFAQQQAGKFGAPRKTVKITHPETHEELRLDKRTDTYMDGGSSGARSLTNVPQSQAIQSFAQTHPINYYPGYNPPLFFQPQNVPLASAQMTTGSQASRYNYPVGQGPPTVSFMNPSISSLPVPKTGPLVHDGDGPAVAGLVSLASAQVTVKPVVVSHIEKVGSSSVVVSAPVVSKGESPKFRPPKEVNTSHPHRDNEVGSEPSSSTTKHSTSASTSAAVQRLSQSISSSAAAVPSDESASIMGNTDGRRRETVKRSDSFTDNQKKLGRKDTRHSQSQQQEDVSDHAIASKSSSGTMSKEVAKLSESVQSPSEVVGSPKSTSSLASHILEHGSFEDRNSMEGNALRVESDKPVLELDGVISDNLEGGPFAKVDLPESRPVQEIAGAVEQGKIGPDEDAKIDSRNCDPNFALKPLAAVFASNKKESDVSEESGSVEPELGKIERLEDCQSSEVDRMDDNNLITPGVISSDSADAEINTSIVVSSDENRMSSMDGSIKSEKSDNQDVSVINSGTSHQELPPSSTELSSHSSSKLEVKATEVAVSGLVSSSMSGSKDKQVEPSRAKTITDKKKKKRKDILKAADAAGSTSDLYMAYKGPEEKQETAVSSGSIDSSSSFNVKEEHVDVEKDAVANEEDVQNKAEPDDWEDAADISTPKLKTSNADEDVNGSASKKYTRDFLLTLSDQCTEVPGDFEIGSDIAEALMGVPVNINHLVESYPNSGRTIDRASGGPRPDRRGSGMMVDDDKWSKSPGPYAPGRDPRLEGVHGGVVTGFRPGQGGNHGVLRNPRGQPIGQYVGGILSGPMQALQSQGGMHRSNSDADRWQRAPGFQKGLIPSPQSPGQIMHKAERKYEVGKVSDEEQAKQRQLKAILNKLTPQNFEKLFEKVKEVNIDNAVTLTGIISQIFDKALMEPTFCEMYANFCFHLASELPDFFEDNEKINFKRLLLNKCQEEFERGEREQAEADRVEEDGEIKCSEEEREEKRVQARRRMLGNIRLIGELYKKKMLTERIMHECIKKLLGQPQNPNPDEEDIEALCKLMSTIGEMIDHPKAKEHMDFYFDIMMKMSNNMRLSSRVRFMLKDSIDLRKNKWQQRRKVEGPKKIDEVHRDAAQERQAQASRLARGPSMGSSGRRQPMDFAPRGSTMSSPNTQMNALRGFPPQNRGFGGQDVRYEERHTYESRMLSVPLSQRPIDDASLTLGPQGGLARGMSGRGEPLISGPPLVDMSRTAGDSRRIPTGPNGYSSAADWTSYHPREEVMQRYSSERPVSVPAYDQLNAHERHAYPGNRDFRSVDRTFDRPMASPVAHAQGPSNASVAVHVASEKVWPEERLRDMSIAAIREFYSAKDKNEVALCIKELNSPSFYPSMVSIWVTDSFERKDLERDLLARLLVDLTNPRDNLLSQVQLMKGFESVLSTLEDAVNDAPKAAEFLGRIFAEVVIENIVPLGDIGRLIHEGGEEPGRLLEIGLASEVLGSILEIIRSEKGEAVLSEMRLRSNLRVEDFRPPDPIKPGKLAGFI